MRTYTSEKLKKLLYLCGFRADDAPFSLLRSPVDTSSVLYSFEERLVVAEKIY